jgi:hypothetical protein
MAPQETQSPSSQSSAGFDALDQLLGSIETGRMSMAPGQMKASVIPTALAEKQVISVICIIIFISNY